MRGFFVWMCDVSLELVDCYRIIRAHQDKGAKAVLQILKEHFPEKTEKQIIAMIAQLSETIGDT